MTKEERSQPDEVTDADWAFAAQNEITNQSVITHKLVIVKGIPKSSPRTIRVTERSIETEKVVATYTLTVGESLREAADVLQDAHDSIRIMRRTYKRNI